MEAEHLDLGYLEYLYHFVYDLCFQNVFWSIFFCILRLEILCYCLCLLLTGIYDDDQEIVTLSRTDFGKYVIKLSESEWRV